MIINLKKYKKNIMLKIYFNLRSIFSDLFSYKKIKNLVIDSKHLDDYFLHKYPRLRVDFAHNMYCVSCHLCTEACPTNAIEVKASGMLDIPQTLTTGEAPKSFKLDLQKCIKCHLCADVCLVDAIDLSGDYHIEEGVVDLVAKSIKQVQAQKKSSSLEVESKSSD